jgi:cysteine-rich repeat protein
VTAGGRRASGSGTIQSSGFDQSFEHACRSLGKQAHCFLGFVPLYFDEQRHARRCVRMGEAVSVKKGRLGTKLGGNVRVTNLNGLGIGGGGGRWRRVEECDDGNTEGGDGCSRTCLIEPGYACAFAFPDVCSPLATAAAIPLQGLLEVTPLGGCSSGGRSSSSSAPAFGWASFVAATPAAEAAVLPAVYRLGPPGTNDASGTGGAGCAAAAAGDGFVCPCAGGGTPPGRVWADAGALEGAAGVVPRDGAACVWTFPYSPILKVAPTATCCFLTPVDADFTVATIASRCRRLTCAPTTIPHLHLHLSFGPAEQSAAPVQLDGGGWRRASAARGGWWRRGGLQSGPVRIQHR